MFRSDAPKCQAIRLLLRSLGFECLWTERSPTAKAVEWLDGSPLSSGENVLLRVRVLEPAGECHARLRLAQRPRLRALRKSLNARTRSGLGRQGVDDWIEGELNHTPVQWVRDAERIRERNQEMQAALVELVSAVQDAQRRRAEGDPNAIASDMISATLKQAIQAIIHYR